MHGLVRCKHESRCSHTRGEDASFTDVKIKLQIGNMNGVVNDVMHRKRGLSIFGIWEKAGSWVPASEEEGWLSGLVEVRPVVCSGGRTWFGADGKVNIERLCVSLSSCRITFNSKVIKFRTWTNFVNVVYFGFPISHIRVSWVWTATAAIGIHPTKAWLSQLVNFKNATWTWGHFRRTICNKILF